MGEKKRRVQAQTESGDAGAGAAGPPNPFGLLVRPALDGDLDQITVIYHHHVVTGTGTFDLDPPGFIAMRQRWAHMASKGWPYLVVCAPQQFSRVLGFAYAQPFRERKAYAQTFEDSIYLAPFVQGRGVGTLLLQALIDDCRARDVRELLAVIGDADNAASIALHRKMGFRMVGRLERVGQKFGRWLDVVMMQKSLTN